MQSGDSSAAAAMPVCEACGYSNLFNVAPTCILKNAFLVIAELFSGAVDDTVFQLLVQQALGAGLVEVCAHVAAEHARTVELENLNMSAMCAVAWVTKHSQCGVMRAVACGLHKLAAASLVVVPTGYKSAALNDLRLISELRAPVRDHAASCAEPDTMAHNRCCLPSCGARCSKGGGPLKHCGGCRVAAFCCIEHQRAQWPQHKALCRARAAVQAALRRLKAQDTER